MKKFWSYLKNSNIIATVLIITFCSALFILRENVVLKEQTVAFCNLMGTGILIVLLFNSVRNGYLKKSYLFFILAGLFSFNRFYDKTVFLKLFKFEIRYFYFGAAIVFTVVILYPLLKKIFYRIGNKISNLLDGWTEDRIEEKAKVQKGLDEKSRKYEEKQRLLRTRRKLLVETGGSVKEKVEEEGEIQEEGNEKVRPKGESRIHTVMTIVVCFLLIGIAILLFAASSSQNSKIVENITSENLLTVILSIAVTIMLIVFIAGIIASLFIKWIQIITDIITRQQKGELYFLYVCGLVLVSQYIFANYSYSMDDIADLLLSGKLFTFPLILSIIIPIFLIFAENIVSFTKNNEVLKNILKECTNETMEIAKGIVESLLAFIKFVTSDFLTTIIKLSEDNEIDEEDIPKNN